MINSDVSCGALGHLDRWKEEVEMKPMGWVTRENDLRGRKSIGPLGD